MGIFGNSNKNSKIHPPRAHHLGDKICAFPIEEGLKFIGREPHK